MVHSRGSPQDGVDAKTSDAEHSEEFRSYLSICEMCCAVSDLGSCGAAWRYDPAGSLRDDCPRIASLIMLSYALPA